ncbi:MAG TPA: Lpg1974 family pore-forming outer membrane protein [Gemmataceae bacterium]|jgi:hypothetical protein
MGFRGWLSGLTACVLLFAAKGGALAQPGSAATSPPPAAPGALPLGDAALPPPKDAASLPSLAVPSLPDNSPAANVAGAEEMAGASSGWLSGLFLDGEYLYLRPHSQSMDYAIANTTSSSMPDGSAVARDWSWRSGLRGGLSYRLPGQPWSVGFYYTYLHDATSGSVAAPDGGFLFATLTHPGTVAEVQTASAATSLNYNVYDLEVGRWCCLTNTFAVRFFGGGRFAHIDQNFTAFYDGGDANQDLVSRQLHFNGGGFRAGAEATQNLFWGLSLFGRANASLVGGEFHSTLLETNNAGATTLTNFVDRFDKVVPVAEMTMGLAWRYQNFRLTAGYQFIDWFGLVNVPTFVDDAHQGKFVRQTSDLSLEGLILRAEWWF